MGKVRPDVIVGKTVRAKTDCGGLFVTLSKEKDELIEVQMSLGKSGNCVRGLLDHIAVLYSVLLQSDIPMAEITKMIQQHCADVSCGNSFYHKSIKYLSCLDFVAKMMLEELTVKTVQEKP